MLKQHIKIHSIIIAVFLLPLISFAQTSNATCSKNGYTIVTINGIFTKEEGIDGAKENMQAVMDRLPTIYNNEPLIFDYLYNPTHGLLDISDVAIQKTNDSAYLLDPDFAKILNDASSQIKTQKVLVVAHSQGNFYANNLYKTVTRNSDMFEKSIGVYSVATPANYVAGNGIYRTSSTDTVINRTRTALPGTVLPANDTINYSKSDDSGKGHAFREIYLEYRGEEIKKEIEESLSRLYISPFRTENTICISPPRTLATSEKIINTAVYPIKVALAGGASAFVYAKNTVSALASGALNFATATLTWTYDTTTGVAKFVGNATVDLASATYNIVVEALTNKSTVVNNQASVILATEQAVSNSTPTVTSVLANNSTPTKQTAKLVAKPTPKPTTTPTVPQAVFVFEPKVETDANTPKLVFVGSFDGNVGSMAVSSPQVLGTQTGTSGADEEKNGGEKVDTVGVALATPTVSAPLCAQTLATDGCLLSTTTVHFEWTQVEGADHYEVNKNGTIATTTDEALDVVVKDFSDYTLDVIAINTDGRRSATSTQKVFVATIPLAINEIAWMGTVASTTREWFEIKNNTPNTIDLSQWELNAKDGTPHVKMTGTIAPREYLVFERIDDTTITDVEAHQIYTGAFENAGEQLSLSHASTTYDQTPSGVWAGGINSTSTRKTMERYSSREPGADPSNWGTNLDYIKNGIDADENLIRGTPGEQNSVSTLINKGQNITSDFTLTADEEQYVIPKTLLISASSTLTIEPGVEIKFYGGGIHVEGQLVVSGTLDNPVLISSLDDKPAGGISVGEGRVRGLYTETNAFASFDNTKIENIDGIIVYDNARLEISNTDMLGISNGIYSDDRAQIIIASSTISGTLNNHSVAAYMDSRVTIASSTIKNNLDNDAIGVYDNAVMTISSTTIDGVPDGNGISVYGRDTYGSTLFLSDSTIKNVDGSGIYVYKATATISNTVIENVGWNGVAIYDGKGTITDTIISGVGGGDGVFVGDGLLSIASSTIKNVSEAGIRLYGATSTISNVNIENGGLDGVNIEGGTASIVDTNVSGFADGIGISVYSEPGTVTIVGGEVTGNEIGVATEELDTTQINVYVHDNGTSDEDNVVVW